MQYLFVKLSVCAIQATLNSFQNLHFSILICCGIYSVIWYIYTCILLEGSNISVNEAMVLYVYKVNVLLLNVVTHIFHAC